MRTPSPSFPKSELSPALRGYLYFTATLCGAAVLIVEILGAKMLSPYFGTSHFVWTAQIAVTLLSLASGYYFGGRLVDRSPRLERLFGCILGAGVYLGFTVPLCRPVAERCLDLNLAVGSLLASLFLFFVPLALLATVGPFLVRVMTFSVSVVGGQVGRLSALSTLGSVLGTLLIGYVLIPFFPNSVTMLTTAALLMGIAAGHFIVNRPSARGAAAVTTMALAGLGAGYLGIRLESHLAVPEMKEVERRNSNFGLMQVLEKTNEPRRYYLNDFLTQNGYDTARKQSFYLFTYMLHGLAHAYTENIDSALCIGLGVGIVPMQLAREGVKVDVVEINPAVVPLAQRYFDFEPERMRIFFDDGRHYLNRSSQKYDTIVLDAFLGDSSPSHLMTREAFSAMRAVLKPGGTLVINSFGDLAYGHDFYTASLEKTLRAVFQSVKVHATSLSGNIFFVASDRAELSFVHKPVYADVHPDVSERVQAAFAGLVESDPQHGRVLRDDFNPVEYYDAENRQIIRRSLAVSMSRKRE